MNLSSTSDAGPGRGANPGESSRRGGSVFPAQELWDLYPNVRVAFVPLDAIRHIELTAILQSFQQKYADRVELYQAGTSVEGRALWAMRIGKGPTRILTWARQHGNEANCTAAVLNALNFVLSRGDHPVARAILEGSTLLAVPMMNPDGVQRFVRRNAMGIDPNRDARKGITPEGATLRRLKDDFAPAIGFNLHDMSPRKATSSEKRLVALALQAGPFDEWGGDNEVRRRAKRLCVRMAEAAGQFAHGHITRYDAPFMPRAFGDAMIRWGVATCLVESGGWWDSEGEEFAARLHFLALLAGLYAAATGAEETANAAYYDSLPLDSGRPYFDLLIRECPILDGSGRPRFVADIGINHDRYHRDRPHEDYRPRGEIKDLGDLSDDRAKAEIAGEDLLVVPGLVAVAPGLRIARPEDTEPLGRFLEAGFTTVVGGCGPFLDPKAFDAWKAQFSGMALVVNYLAFEVVESIAEVMRRHGQTEAYGLLVPDLTMRPADLLVALHLFHPAAHSALTEEQAAIALSVDLLLHAEGHPRTNRLHLLVRRKEPSRSGRKFEFASAESVRNLFAAFLRHPDQIGVSVDTSCPTLGFFPTPPLIGGIGGGQLPPATFLERTMKTLQCTTEDGLGMIVSRLTRQPALALGLQDIGLVRQDYRADLALFELESGGDPAAPLASAQIHRPVSVLVNGLLSLVDGAATGRHGGLLLLR